MVDRQSEDKQTNKRQKADRQTNRQTDRQSEVIQKTKDRRLADGWMDGCYD